MRIHGHPPHCHSLWSLSSARQGILVPWTFEGLSVEEKGCFGYQGSDRRVPRPLQAFSQYFSVQFVVQELLTRESAAWKLE